MLSDRVGRVMKGWVMLASVKGGDGFGRLVSGWRPLCVGDGSSNSLDRVDL